MIFFTPVSLFFPPRPCNNCSTFTGGVLGENILSLFVNVSPLCLFFPLAMPLPSFLESFLVMSLRRNNKIFSPLVWFFPTCDRKLVKNLREERKTVYFSIFP